MMNEMRIGCNGDNSGVNDESLEGVNYLKTQVSKLSAQIEHYKQELYELNRKYEISRGMEVEMGEFQKNLEQSLEQEKTRADRKIHEMEEKYHGQRKELEEKVAETELELARKIEENCRLQENAKIMEDRLASFDQSQCSTFIEDHQSEELKLRIDELTVLLEEERMMRKQYEETVEVMGREFDELREILAATKSQLAEKNSVVESMRGELVECKAELEAARITPAEDNSKGNSLFAEVEDRRKMTVGQMNAMRASYLESKRSFQAKEAEIKSLKAERSLLLRKWEDEAIEKIQEDASLVEKYKSRIGELEARLKDEQKKQKENSKRQRQSPENNYVFLQSLLDEKTKKIEELSSKIENDSIQALIDEEQKHKMGKQLRYWRYKAMSGQSELLSIKDSLERDSSSTSAEILETIKKCLNNKSIEKPDELFFKDESTYGEASLVNETVDTFEKLTTIPKVNLSSKMWESTDSDEAIVVNCKSLNEGWALPLMDETEIFSTIIHSSKVPLVVEKLENPIESVVVDDTEETHKKPSSSLKKEGMKNDEIFSIKAEILKPIINKENEDPRSILASKEKSEKEKKSLRFTEDTADPPGNPVRKIADLAPKYPIIHISSSSNKSSKK